MVLAFAAGLASSAAADPCKAIPDRGRAPPWLHPGAAFSGPIVYVGDGDSFCVATGPQRTQWVEVRVADFYAPELAEPGGAAAKLALERIALGRQVRCTAGRQSYDRVVATCLLEGGDLGDLMRAAHVTEGGRGWR